MGKRNQRLAGAQTPQLDQEDEVGPGSADGVDQRTSLDQNWPGDENTPAEVSRLLELLWSHRQFQKFKDLLLPRVPDGVQVAQSAKPEIELHLGGIQQTAATLCHPSSADHGGACQRT